MKKRLKERHIAAFAAAVLGFAFGLGIARLPAPAQAGQDCRGGLAGGIDETLARLDQIELDLLKHEEASKARHDIAMNAIRNIK